MVSKLSKISSGPTTYIIRGQDVKIYPLDYEDTLDLMQLKRDASNNVMVSDKENIAILKKVTTKKIKQSFTEIVNNKKEEPTDEEISNIDINFYNEYIKDLFDMVKMTSEEVKKK